MLRELPIPMDDEVPGICSQYFATEKNKKKSESKNVKKVKVKCQEICQSQWMMRSLVSVFNSLLLGRIRKKSESENVNKK